MTSRARPGKRDRRPRAAARRPVLLVAAFAPELREARRILRADPALRRRVVLRTVGVGLVEAAAGAARAIATQRPDAVLLVGTAGVYPGPSARRFPLGAAVPVARARLLAPESLARAAYLPAPMTKLAAWIARTSPRGRAAARATVASPLAITRSATLARAIAHATRADLENLEAFAVARAAARARVRFACVLGVSNRVGPGAHAEWRAHAGRAAAAACRAALAAIAAD